MQLNRLSDDQKQLSQTAEAELIALNGPILFAWNLPSTFSKIMYYRCNCKLMEQTNIASNYNI